ncbi:histidine phosphatase family protein [Ramlibacter albus]|uniref:Histidine phosphatase family protein n=1 Tax=Ramlibacter albus TaxID=2079448 RepID=A0A923M7U8_9BURK|nr:histidine phosphatase family protein [Ramlibacter albus]
MKTLFVLAAATFVAACSTTPESSSSLAPGGAQKPVTVIIVRHAETDASRPETLPLSAQGRARAQQLAETVKGVRFTHLFATHRCGPGRCLMASRKCTRWRSSSSRSPVPCWKGSQ